LLQSRNLQRPEAGERWSVVCFFVQRAFRRRGLGVRLLKAATDAAIVHGVSEVEGYPKKVRAGSWPPGPFIWTGTEAMFAAAGYRKLSRGEEMPPIYVFSVPWAFSPRACPLGTGDGVDLGRGRARPRLPAKLALAANRGPVYLLGTGESVETPMATSPVIPAKAGS
jgi:hypothetical protein